MRYSKEEQTYILGIFNSGDTVTIDIYRLSDNTKVIDSANCTEIGTTGVFKYLFSQTVTQKEEYLWIMSNGNYSKYGKIVLGGYIDDIRDDISEHRNTVESKIDAKVSSRVAADDPRLNNLDARVSSRSSHSPMDVWNYSSRTLTAPVNLADGDKDDIVDRVWDEPVSEHATAGTFGEKNQNKVPSESIDDYKADTSNIAKEETVQAIKSKTDKLRFNTNNDVVATLDGERVSLDVDTENMIRIILGLVQHNYRLFNVTYTTVAGRKKLTSATVRIYNTRDDCMNDTNPIKTYALSVQYDDDGYVIDYKCVEE